MEINEFTSALPEYWMGGDDWFLSIGVLGLMEESGEVSGFLKKMLRDKPKDRQEAEKRRAGLLLELGDTAFYASVVGHHGLGLKLRDDIPGLGITMSVTDCCIGLNQSCVDLANHGHKVQQSPAFRSDMGARSNVELIFAYIDAIARYFQSDLQDVLDREMEKLIHRKKERDART